MKLTLLAQLQSKLCPYFIPFRTRKHSNMDCSGYPVTYIWDVSSLEAPKQTGLYKGKCSLS
jgi:hypothetical protein